jgi:hypothetical protein
MSHANLDAPSPFAVFWESLRPDSLYRVLLLLIVAFGGGAFWLFAVWRHPGVPLNVLVMFRNGGGAHGDALTYPMITSFLSAHDTVVFESSSFGLQPSGVAGLLPYGVCYALFGIYGFIIADIIVKLLYYASLAGLLKTLGIRAEYLAESISAFFVANGREAIAALSTVVSGKLWIIFLGGDMRIPRPFVTDVFFFGALALLLLPYFRELRTIPYSVWVALGGLLSALMQGDITLFIVLGMALPFQVALLLWKAFRDRGLRPRIAKALALQWTAFAVVSVPFVIQRLSEHPDFVIRVGLFPVARTSLLFSREGLPYFFCATAMAAGTWALLLVGPRRDRVQRTRPILALWAVAALGIAALPVSSFLMGKAVQTYHFGLVLRFICSLLIVLCAGHVVEAVAGYANSYPRGQVVVRAGRRIAQVLVCVLSLYYATAVAWDQAEARGAPGFLAMANMLDANRREEWKVVGTLDPMVSWWWTAFGGHYAYVPDCTRTPLADAQLEERFVSFCREVGMGTESFRQVLSDQQTIASWLGGLKYQAFRGYAIAPLEDYSERDRQWIRHHTSEECWQRLSLPTTTVTRLTRLFEAARPISDDAPRLDLIVLSNEPNLRNLTPPPDRYELIYANETYRVWERKRDSAANG